jgi:hypothetical protein
MKATAIATQVAQEVKTTFFTTGQFVQVKGWHPYNVAYIEEFLPKGKVVVEHEGMYFTLRVTDLIG